MLKNTKQQQDPQIDPSKYTFLYSPFLIQHHFTGRTPSATPNTLPQLKKQGFWPCWTLFIEKQINQPRMEKGFLVYCYFSYFVLVKHSPNANGLSDLTNFLLKRLIGYQNVNSPYHWFPGAQIKGAAIVSQLCWTDLFLWPFTQNWILPSVYHKIPEMSLCVPLWGLKSLLSQCDYRVVAVEAATSMVESYFCQNITKLSHHWALLLVTILFFNSRPFWFYRLHHAVCSYSKACMRAMPRIPDHCDIRGNSTNHHPYSTANLHVTISLAVWGKFCRWQITWPSCHTQAPNSTYTNPHHAPCAAPQV